MLKKQITAEECLDTFSLIKTASIYECANLEMSSCPPAIPFHCRKVHRVELDLIHLLPSGWSWAMSSQKSRMWSVSG